MTPDEFIDKWKRSTLGERQAAHSHFEDLCRLLGEQTPAEADPEGAFYCFERGATKATGGKGWADVWKREHFGWEYKGPGRDLDAAYRQLLNYSVALENPPLLIVSDTKKIVVRTNWTNTVQRTWEIELDDLRDGGKRQILKDAFSNPEKLKPEKTRQQLTEQAAKEFAELAKRLHGRGHDPQVVAHFVNRLVFCMFAEDVRLLPNDMFTRMLEHTQKAPTDFEVHAATLFGAMKGGGLVGFEKVEWFNGGLFDDTSALPLEKDDIALVLNAAKLDWSDIDPSILGTLFERGLDPDKRSQLGAHYTDRDKIMLIVNPVIVEPLTREWEETRAQIIEQMRTAEEARQRRPEMQREARRVHAVARRQEEAALRRARRLHAQFIERLRDLRVLDPACGSGNFLYLSLLALKDIEHRANLDVESLGLGRFSPTVGPECLKGIEINLYAAELARVSVWIGEIQWMRRNGFSAGRNPILRPLKTIECRDAVLNPDGTAANWPEAEFIVGNPPFLGNKRMISVLGEDYTTRLRKACEGRVPGGADLVTFWFEKAREAVEAASAKRVGLVGTNSIRGGENRKVLERIRDTALIVEAWSDEPWIVEGAAVRVSLVCFATEPVKTPRLDGEPVLEVYSDLTGRHEAHGSDLTKAKRLSANCANAFQGPVKVGPFNIPGKEARRFLQLPLNPNGRPNSDVVKPWANGMDITRRPSDTWIIDFAEMTESEACLYEGPFEYVRSNVQPIRKTNRDRQRRENWWRLGRSGSDLKDSIKNTRRYIITPRVAKHRLFTWMLSVVLPDSATVAIARDDDMMFGIIHSRYHELWSLGLCTWLGVGNDPRYTPSTTFETFPFPDGLSPDIPAADYIGNPKAQAIARTARELDKLRENWLNPLDLVRRVPEVVPGYPDRIMPVSESAATTLKKRTLTNLYNERPTWLENAHREVDEAVAAAYGWSADLRDEEILNRLFELNQERATR